MWDAQRFSDGFVGTSWNCLICLQCRGSATQWMRRCPRVTRRKCRSIRYTYEPATFLGHTPHCWIAQLLVVARVECGRISLLGWPSQLRTWVNQVSTSREDRIVSVCWGVLNREAPKMPCTVYYFLRNGWLGILWESPIIGGWDKGFLYILTSWRFTHGVRWPRHSEWWYFHLKIAYCHWGCTKIAFTAQIRLH